MAVENLTYPTAWMNQFEIKYTCIEFVINNVSLQGNNVKIKSVETAVLIFCEINGNAPGFCLVLSDAYS